MLRFSSCSRAFALACVVVALSAVQALAHCFVGDRFFPATLATDDPCVAVAPFRPFFTFLGERNVGSVCCPRSHPKRR